MKNPAKFLFVGALLGCLVSCGGKSGTSGSAGQQERTTFPRAETLYLAGFQWGAPNTFNPLIDQPAWPIYGPPFNLMYEPLVLYNTLSGKMDPLLASVHEQTADHISVIMNPAARWSDNKPLTAADVTFTFEIGKRFKSAPVSYVWDFVSKITVEKVADPAGGGGKELEKVTFHVNKEKENNQLALLNILKSFQILPSHVLEARLKALDGNFSELQKDSMDKDPVVSGPYNLHAYSPEKIILERRDAYWGNKALYGGRMPQPKYIIHPIYKSNDHFSIALQKGDLDVNSNFIPRIWLKFKSGVGTWFKDPPYFEPGSIPMFTINTTRYPLSDRNYRRAMAHAINYTNVKELAVSGYSPDLNPGLILPFGNEAAYFSAEDAAKYGAGHDLDRAKQVLADAGYTSIFKDGKLDHMENAKGEKVPTMRIRSPAGWSDWESIVKIAVKDLRAAGIDVREGFCDEGLYWQTLPTGNFDLMLQTPEASLSPALPWSRFKAVMASRNWKPEGEKMNENQGRYNSPKGADYNPRVDELIQIIPNLANEEAKKAAYRELNVIFMKDQPALPVVYRPEEFYDFSTKHWTNFATKDNPYAPPQLPCFGAGRNMLWEIKPVQ